mmetsp:Transcript_20485/g.44461  ORF Transcript_20485/g.44461 Transcript_20485/m.44461 type:complete len:95 (-) Transcript_20485:68-352(-)
MASSHPAGILWLLPVCRRGSTTNFPSCQQFVRTYPIGGYMVANWIAELEFNNEISSIKTLKLPSSGNWVDITGDDNIFVITEHGVEHPDVPSQT